MPSWQTRAVAAVLRATRRRAYRSEASGLLALEKGRPATPPPARMVERVRTDMVAGFPVSGVSSSGSPGGTSAPGAIVYVHGGAFVNGIAKQHWALIDLLAERTGRSVLVPFYGLAPAHTAAEAVPFLRAVVDTLRPGPVHLVGDSAGGNLALLTAQALRGDPDVAGLTLIAPALDLSMSNPELEEVERTDPWLARAGLRPMLRAWAGDADLDDPAVSPLFGDLTGLPPTLLLAGTRDICWPDARDLYERAGEGWDLTLVEETGSLHVHPLLPTPEGRAARRTIVDHVGATLTPAVAAAGPGAPGA